MLFGAVVVGAIVSVAASYQLTGSRHSSAGLILLIACASGFVTSKTVFAISRGHVGGSQYETRRPVVDSAGLSTLVHEDPKRRDTTSMIALRTSKVNNLSMPWRTMRSPQSLPQNGKESQLCTSAVEQSC